jgi:hypothetical protein
MATDAGVVVLLAIGCTFAVPIVIVGTIFAYKHYEDRMWHETARLALEKGQPVPPRCQPDDLKVPPGTGSDPADWQRWRAERKRWRDIQGGLIMLAIGIALFLGLGGRGPQSIPAYLMIGIGSALLVSGLLQAIFSRHHADYGPQPPPV